MYKGLQSFFMILAVAMTHMLGSCTKPSLEGNIIITAVSNKQQAIEFKTMKYRGLLDGAKILAINTENKPSTALLLTDDFYAACSPDISFDARKMVFAGQKSNTDIWQIYEMDLSSLRYIQLTNASENCTDPIYLPGERIAYSKVHTYDLGFKGHALMVMQSDGSQQQQITYSPGSYVGSLLLHDGRIISMNQQIGSETEKRNLMVMRPDGTKETLFYKSRDQDELITLTRETADGQMVLLENNEAGKEQLFTLTYNNPMHGKKIIHGEIAGDILGVSLLNNENLLVCYKANESDDYGLYELDYKNSGQYSTCL